MTRVLHDEDGCPYIEGPGGERIYTAAGNQAGGGLLADVRNGKWLDAQNFPPLEHAVDRLIPEGLSLLVGPPKIGKSFLMLDVGLGVAAGGRVLGQIPVEQRPVFYLALEDGHRRLQDRCRLLLGAEAIPEAFEYVTVVAPGQVFDTIEAWLADRPGDKPLLILDTLGKVMPPALMGESSYQRDYRVGSALKRMADSHPGAALVVNHHDRKAGGEDFVDSVSGTHGLAGAADTVIVLNRARQQAEGLVKVTGRDITEGEYAVKFTGRDFWQLDGHGWEAAARAATTRKATSGLGDTSARVVEYVTSQPGPVRVQQVADALSIPYHKAGTYLSRAVDAGRLQRHGRGSYTPVKTVNSLIPGGALSPNGINNLTLLTPPLGGAV